MNISERRAIRITELTEQLEVAKKIIEEFVWPSDCDVASRQKAMKDAARFAGCPVPQYEDSAGGTVQERPNVRNQYPSIGTVSMDSD